MILTVTSLVGYTNPSLLSMMYLLLAGSAARRKESLWNLVGLALWGLSEAL